MFLNACVKSFVNDYANKNNTANTQVESRIACQYAIKTSHCYCYPPEKKLQTF